jgi:hypothetical protein
VRSAILATLALVALARQTSQLELGRYQGTLTTSAPRQLAGGVIYVTCRDLLYISLKDTLSHGLSMNFMTRVATLRLGAYQARPWNFYTPVLPSPADTNLSGSFNLFIGPDTAFFPGSGSLRLNRIVRNELVGSFDYASIDYGTSKPRVTIRGAFRAVRKSAHCP